MQGKRTRNATRGTRLLAVSACAPVAPPSLAYASPARAAPVARCAALSSAAATSRPGDALRRERALMGKLGARSAPWRDLSSATIVYRMRVTIEYCVV